MNELQCSRVSWLGWSMSVRADDGNEMHKPGHGAGLCEKLSDRGTG